MKFGRKYLWLPAAIFCILLAVSFDWISVLVGRNYLERICSQESTLEIYDQEEWARWQGIIKSMSESTSSNVDRYKNEKNFSDNNHVSLVERSGNPYYFPYDSFKRSQLYLYLGNKKIASISSVFSANSGPISRMFSDGYTYGSCAESHRDAVFNKLFSNEFLNASGVPYVRRKWEESGNGG
jgi:hypothetical protein